MMCSEDDLKELGIPMGPRKKILSYQKDYAKEKVCCNTCDTYSNQLIVNYMLRALRDYECSLDCLFYSFL
jgi:hypothetical protein